MIIIKEHCDKEGKALQNRAERRYKKRFRVRNKSFRTSHNIAQASKLLGGLGYFA